MPDQRKIYILLPLFIVASFFIYSSRHYPLLNSDDALNVLMTWYYKLPHDIYCWGQDRGGTIIPLISQVFLKLFGFSAINAVSLSNYFILILGYIGISSLFRNTYTKILFAFVWFFPPIRFVDLMRFPIGVQYSLLGFAIFLINRIDLRKGKKFINHLLIFLVVLVLSVSIWVSDLAMVSVTLLILVLMVFHVLKKKQFQIPPIVYLYGIAGAAGTWLFIRYAKRMATGVTRDYTAFNDWSSMFKGISILKTEIINVFTFQSIDLVFSLYAWLVTTGVLLLIFSRARVSLPEPMHRWLVFFLVDLLAVLGVMVLSKWVFLNGMGRWYFVSTYISLSVALLILVDNLKLEKRKHLAVTGFFLLTLLVGAASTLHYLKYVHPRTLRSQIDVRSEFLTLGEIGIIGEFWNSYISACPDPSRIKATAHDKSVVRNLSLVDEVFAQPNIYVIKDMWMETFPDTLRQFGHILLKEGESFKLANCDVNRYVLLHPNDTDSTE